MPESGRISRLSPLQQLNEIGNARLLQIHQRKQRRDYMYIVLPYLSIVTFTAQATFGTLAGDEAAANESSDRIQGCFCYIGSMFAGPGLLGKEVEFTFLALEACTYWMERWARAMGTSTHPAKDRWTRD